MPSPLRQLTLQGVRDQIAGRTCRPPPRGEGNLVGLETEWLATVAGSPTEPVPYERTLAVVGALGALPGGSRITFEPGGQVELSGPPAATCGDAARAMARDVATLGTRLRPAGIALDPPGPARHRAPA